MMVLFKQVDVFTVKPFQGNPVAVVMDASTLTTEQMQQIARWTNLSETTFVLPAQSSNADYHVRIFTPVTELPFAGHPTIGTAYALLEEGLISVKNGKIIQECGAGLVNLTVQNAENGQYKIAFELPQPKITILEPEQIAKVAKTLGCSIDYALTPALVDVGARWIVVHTENAETVLNAKPDFVEMAAFSRELNVAGVCLYGAWSDTHIEVRSFAPAYDVNEDPVCGSGNGSVAAFIRYYQQTAHTVLKSSQGSCVGRDGHLVLTIQDEQIWVEGQAVTCIQGQIKI